MWCVESQVGYKCNIKLIGRFVQIIRQVLDCSAYQLGG